MTLTPRLTTRYVLSSIRPAVPGTGPPPPPTGRPPRDPASPYLDVHEAAAYCRVAVKTIYNNRRFIERMPGVGKLVFRREALDRWLSQRRKPVRGR